jgi:transcriptional antiterminator RfaH
MDQRAPAERPSRAAEKWYCVRTHPKHEHIAAAQLRQQQNVEVFLPRIRYRRATRLGPAWVTEALFKDYVFARFDLSVALRRVQHSRAVCSVVHFGDYWPILPDQVICELQAAVGGADVWVVEDTIQAGDTVQINSGAMCGLEAVVTRVMPAKQRVAVLLDFLGRQTTVELDCIQLALPSGEESQRRRAPVLTDGCSLAIA